MTRSFLRRSAVAAVLLAIGLAFVWGDKSRYDQFIETYSVFQVVVVMVAFIAFLVGLLWWVGAAARTSHWFSSRATGHRGKKSAAVIAIVAAACIASINPARAWSTVPITVQAAPVPVSIDQPFTLSPDVQRQVDAAIVEASKGAKENPGFTVTIECAVGLFIAAVLTTVGLVIIVRMITKSLNRMSQSLSNRLGKVKDFLINPTGTTNQPVLLGAALFNHRPATDSDLPSGRELVLDLVSPEPAKPALLMASLCNPETITFEELTASFGIPDKWPLDATIGNAISRQGAGYSVVPEGQTNLVTLIFESCQGLGNAFKSVLSLRVPVGAILDVSDLSGASEGRFWRVGVAQ